MPTYEYACKGCGHRVEVVQSLSDEPLKTCGVCGGELRKVFHPAGVLFKGSGFYSTDNRSKEGSDSSKKGGESSASPSPSSGSSSSSSESSKGSGDTASRESESPKKGASSDGRSPTNESIPKKKEE